ncbi:MAG: thioesterase [Acidimicrobiia bacterium]
MDRPVEFVDPPAQGRRYEITRNVHLDDTDATGAVGIDAVARFLQDVATDDAHDAGLYENARGVWVLRRADVALVRRPVLYEALNVLTFCSGSGPAWAERRTRIRGDDGAVLVESAAIWVYIDREKGRPLPLEPSFADWYGEAAMGRRVSGKLQLPGPPADAAAREWTVRHSDFDILDHVNNARSLEAVADELVRRLPGTRPVAFTVEYKGMLERGDVIELRSVVSEPAGPGSAGDAELAAWLMVDGDVRVAARVRASHLH